MDVKERIIEVMRAEGKPLNAGKIAEIGCLDRKEVDKAMAKSITSFNTRFGPKNALFQSLANALEMYVSEIAFNSAICMIPKVLPSVRSTI